MYALWYHKGKQHTEAGMQTLYLPTSYLLDYMHDAGWPVINDDYHIEHAMDAFQEHIKNVKAFYGIEDFRFHVAVQDTYSSPYLYPIYSSDEQTFMWIFEDYTEIVRSFKIYGRRHYLLKPTDLEQKII